MTDSTVFSGSTLNGYCIAGIVWLLMPVLALLLMKRQRAVRIFPVILGVTVYFTAVQFSDLFAHIIGFSRGFAEKTVIAAELVSALEEVGRWFAMRYPVTGIRSTSAAVCFGIGHGGLECWIRGFQQFQIMQYGRQVNAEGIGSFLTGKTPERAAEITAQLQQYAARSPLLCLTEILHSMTTFGVQLALTLFLYKKMQESDFDLRWLLLAVLLHDALNAVTLAASLTGSTLFTSFAGLLGSIALIWFVSRKISFGSCIYQIKHPPETETA